jgi:hypothetical protein
MSVTQNQLDLIVEKTFLDVTAKAALKEALGLLLTEVNAIQAAPIITHALDTGLPNALVATAGTGVTITLNSPVSTGIEFSV